MKKIIAILLGVALSVSTLASAKAVEITGGMSDIWWANTDTNGKTSVAYWDIWNYENQNYDNYFVFNFDGTDEGWSEPVVVGADYVFDVEVLSSGKIIYVYLDNDDDVVYLQSTMDGNNFSIRTELPVDNGMTIDSDSELVIDSLGKIITIIGEFRDESSVHLFSWISNKTQSAWTKKVVTDNVFPTSTFDFCEYSSETCFHGIQNLTFGQNAKGQQSLVARVKVATNSADPNTEQWANIAYQRKSATSNWKSPQVLDTFGPEEINSYTYMVGPVVVTPKGKSAYAYSKGYNDDPHAIQIFVSSGFGKKFVRKDQGVLSSVYGTESPTLVNVGEKIYTAFNKNTSAEDEDHPDVYFGEVGKLNKAKKVGTAGSHRMVSFGQLNGKLTVVSESESDGKFSVQVRKFNGKKWSGPKTILNHPNGFGISPWDSGCDVSAKLFICSASVLAEAYDPENYQNPIGLNVEIIR
ncbi:MAG: hypothetical protein NT032_06840 [Actinobacteria bacterium]|nr:hypothetical protein [Actinomycetota bacterium]